MREIRVSPRVRTAVLAVSALSGSEALEEYFGLLAGAAGALFGGRANRLGPVGLGVLLGSAAAALGAAGLAQQPAGLVGIALFYGLGRIALVVGDARLQASITGSSRATVGSIAGLGSELAGMAMFGCWALGGLGLAVALVFAAALVLPRSLSRT